LQETTKDSKKKVYGPYKGCLLKDKIKVKMVGGEPRTSQYRKQEKTKNLALKSSQRIKMNLKHALATQPYVENNPYPYMASNIHKVPNDDLGLDHNNEGNQNAKNAKAIINAQAYAKNAKAIINAQAYAAYIANPNTNSTATSKARKNAEKAKVKANAEEAKARANAYNAYSTHVAEKKLKNASFIANPANNLTHNDDEQRNIIRIPHNYHSPNQKKNQELTLVRKHARNQKYKRNHSVN
jgi:Spy/CpxP family protein refolding chaperone